MRNNLLKHWYSKVASFGSQYNGVVYRMTVYECNNQYYKIIGCPLCKSHAPLVKFSKPMFGQYSCNKNKIRALVKCIRIMEDNNGQIVIDVNQQNAKKRAVVMRSFMHRFLLMGVYWTDARIERVNTN